MREIDFFSSTRGLRSGDERLRRIVQLPNKGVFTPDYMEFGFDYFDNPELNVGYGGYAYDGRFRRAVELICAQYDLSPGDKVLEVGCAKGYLMMEFIDHGIDVVGLDKSAYATENAHPLVKSKLVRGDICEIPFNDGHFDLVIAKEVLPHVNRENISRALLECQRVSGGAMFFEIQTGGTAESRENILRWDATHCTIEPPEWWKKRFDELNISPLVNFRHLFPGAA
jgi:cyclopropane fatty-acyl-phospholipid synthase-like methyltransferase